MRGFSGTCGWLAVCAGLLFGCDCRPPARHASAPLSQRVAEISVRVDAPSGGVPSVSLLAFRASVTGAGTGDVLGLVDPLVAAAPTAGCELRELALATRTLRAQGGSVELEAL